MRRYGPRLQVVATGVRQIHSRTMNCHSIFLDRTILLGTRPSLVPGMFVRTFFGRTPFVAFVVEAPGDLLIHRLLRLRMVLFLQDHLFLLFLLLCPLGLFLFLCFFPFGSPQWASPFGLL